MFDLQAGNPFYDFLKCVQCELATQSQAKEGSIADHLRSGAVSNVQNRNNVSIGTCRSRAAGFPIKPSKTAGATNLGAR